jgi:acyl-CoA-dependent ceramide synthase
LRHYLNLKILWAILTTFRTVGPFELDWATEQYKCLLSQNITFGLLASLQAVNLIWLFLILRIAKNYAFNSVRQDDRSDNEDDEEEEETPSNNDRLKAEGEEANGIPVSLQNGNEKSSVQRRTAVEENEAPQVLVNGQPVEARPKNASTTTNGKKKTR